MNPFIEPTVIVSVWWLVSVGLLALERRIHLASMLAPTDWHVIGWLVGAVVCTTIVRSYMHGAIALPNVRRMVAPKREYRRYARREVAK